MAPITTPRFERFFSGTTSSTCEVAQLPLVGGFATLFTPVTEAIAARAAPPLGKSPVAAASAVGETTTACPRSSQASRA